MEAQVQMRQAKKVKRLSWPDGKHAFYDTNKDGVPDELPLDHPDFIQRSQANYDHFLKNIVVIGGSQTDITNRPFITQEDSLATDWELCEAA